MEIKFERGGLTVKRSDGPRARNESDFWYQLRNILRSKGLNVVKKAPAKDGHLTSAPYYLRERLRGVYCVHDDYYAIRNLAQDYNSHQPVTLSVYGDIAAWRFLAAEAASKADQKEDPNDD